MRLTSAQLRQIVTEETEKVLLEQSLPKLPKLTPQDFAADIKKQGSDEKIVTEVDAGTIIGGILAAPKLLEWLGDSITLLGKLPIFKRFNTNIGEGMVKIAHAWHKTYIKMVYYFAVWPFAKAHEKITKQPGFVKSNQEFLWKMSEALFLIIIAGAFALSLAGAVKNLTLQGGSTFWAEVESVLSVAKIDEIAEFAGVEELVLSIIASFKTGRSVSVKRKH